MTLQGVKERFDVVKALIEKVNQRVPVGSLVVDSALVLMLVYTSGQITERLETLDQRVARIEQTPISPEVEGRLQVLKTQADGREEKVQQSLEDMRKYLGERLDRIERKLDK